MVIDFEKAFAHPYARDMMLKHEPDYKPSDGSKTNYSIGHRQNKPRLHRVKPNGDYVECRLHPKAMHRKLAYINGFETMPEKELDEHLELLAQRMKTTVNGVWKSGSASRFHTPKK